MIKSGKDGGNRRPDWNCNFNSVDHEPELIGEAKQHTAVSVQWCTRAVAFVGSHNGVKSGGRHVWTGEDGRLTKQYVNLRLRSRLRRVPGPLRKALEERNNEHRRAGLPAGKADDLTRQGNPPNHQLRNGARMNQKRSISFRPLDHRDQLSVRRNCFFEGPNSQSRQRTGELDFFLKSSLSVECVCVSLLSALVPSTQTN